MIKGQDDKLRQLFSQQLQIINEIKLNLDSDLYVFFEGEKEARKMENKIAKLQKMKIQLIKIFASLIGEF